MVMIKYLWVGLRMMHAKDQVCLMSPGAAYSSMQKDTAKNRWW